MNIFDRVKEIWPGHNFFSIHVHMHTGTDRHMHTGTDRQG